MNVWIDRLRLKYLFFALLVYVLLAAVLNLFWGSAFFDFDAVKSQLDEKDWLNWQPPYFATYPRMLFYLLMPALVTWTLFVLLRAERALSSALLAILIPFCFPILSVIIEADIADFLSARADDWSALYWLYVVFAIPCLIIGGINAMLVRFLPPKLPIKESKAK